VFPYMQFERFCKNYNIIINEKQQIAIFITQPTITQNIPSLNKLNFMLTYTESVRKYIPIIWIYLNVEVNLLVFVTPFIHINKEKTCPPFIMLIKQEYFHFKPFIE
jgi:hypothetical protein